MLGLSTNPVKMLKKIRIFNLVLATLGIALSAAAVFVEYKKKLDKNYVAFCDISESISCSDVFMSKYGRGFGLIGLLLGEENPLVLPNGAYGIIFYLVIIGLGELTTTNSAIVQKSIALLSNFMSIYLGYILVYVLWDLCLVCVSSFIINFLITVCCFIRVKILLQIRGKKKSSKKKN